MNYGLRYGLDLLVYDRNDKLIATIDYLTYAKIEDDKLKISTQIISDELLNILYQSETEKKPFLRNVFRINKNRVKNKYKIIAKTKYVCEEDGMPRSCQYVMPKVKIENKPAFVHRPTGDGANFFVTFKILPFNRRGDLYSINFIEN